VDDYQKVDAVFRAFDRNLITAEQARRHLIKYGVLMEEIINPAKPKVVELSEKEVSEGASHLGQFDETRSE
jgi:hypothetical protein